MTSRLWFVIALLGLGHALMSPCTWLSGNLFQARKAWKEYLAIVYGHVREEGYIIDAPIAPYIPKPGEEYMIPTGSTEEKKDFRMAVGGPENPGRSAQTEVKVLEWGTYAGKPVSKLLLIPRSPPLGGWGLRARGWGPVMLRGQGQVVGGSGSRASWHPQAGPVSPRQAGPRFHSAFVALHVRVKRAPCAPVRLAPSPS